MNKRRVVFLDIDGVLNDTHFIDAVIAEAERTGVAPEDGVAALTAIIDPRRVEYLNEIVEKSGAEVVAATSWRELLTLDELNDALRRQSFRGSVTSATPSEPQKRRGRQIAAWLAANQDVKTFVILDDDHDMEPMESSTLRTLNTVGLTREHVREALRRLE